MQWFQVTCPSCAAHLQVRLPEGITSVQCSECKAVFAVQIQPTALTPQAQPASSKRSRKRKAEKDLNAPPRALSAYNVFMKAEVAKVKAQHPELPHREAFKMAAERWQASPMNPQNGGERFPTMASGPEVDSSELMMQQQPGMVGVDDGQGGQVGVGGPTDADDGDLGEAPEGAGVYMPVGVKG